VNWFLHPTDFYGYTSHFYNGDLFMEMDVAFPFPTSLLAQDDG